MAGTIFYSWQSNSPNKTNRGFIRQALDDAVKELNKSLDVEEALRVDQDTKGISGTPSITDVILQKIRECNIFIADFTFVGSSEEGRKLIPNPNVLIEYGYALRHLGDKRIINVMNTAFGNPQGLPFDLQHKRYPIQYHLNPDDNSETRKDVREKLTKQFLHAIEAVVIPPSADPEYSAIQAQDGVASFLGKIEPLTPRRPVYSGQGYKGLHLRKAPRLFLRVIPSKKYEPLNDFDTMTVLRDSQVPPLAGGEYRRWESARNSYGAFKYCFIDEDPQTAWAIVQLFKQREIWGIDTHFLREEKLKYTPVMDRNYVPVRPVESALDVALKSYIQCARDFLGIEPPIRIIMGMAGIGDFTVTSPENYSNKFAGDLFDDEISREEVLESYDQDSTEIVSRFIDHLWQTAGVEPPG